MSRSESVEWQQYEQWQTLKTRRMSRANWAMGLAFVAMVVVQGGRGLGIPSLVSPVLLLVLLWGAVQMCDAKGRTRWFALLGIFTALLGDRNVMLPPDGAGETAVKKLSDW